MIVVLCVSYEGQTCGTILAREMISKHAENDRFPFHHGWMITPIILRTRGHGKDSISISKVVVDNGDSDDKSIAGKIRQVGSISVECERATSIEFGNLLGRHSQDTDQWF